MTVSDKEFKLMKTKLEKSLSDLTKRLNKVENNVFKMATSVRKLQEHTVNKLKQHDHDLNDAYKLCENRYKQHNRDLNDSYALIKSLQKGV